MTRACAELRDGTPVGAWLFKANPAVWDVLGALERHEDLDSWRMAPSYRVGLVAPGHPCALWVTGPRSAPYRAGVWAVGTVVSVPYDDVGDPDDPSWFDRGAARQVRPYVKVDLRVLSTPIDRDDLRGDPRFAGSEILRRPRMGSPVAITPDEWTAVRDRFLDGPAPE